MDYLVTYVDHCGCDVQAPMTQTQLDEAQAAERDRHEFPSWLPQCPDHLPGRP